MFAVRLLPRFEHRLRRCNEFFGVGLGGAAEAPPIQVGARGAEVNVRRPVVPAFRAPALPAQRVLRGGYGGGRRGSLPVIYASTNALRWRPLNGCRSFLSAFTSICRMRSRVTAKRLPTSSSVCSPLSPR